MKIIIQVIVVFLFQISFAQTNESKLIHGKIIAVSGNVEGVTIVNLVNEKSTVSDRNGDFYILAKTADLLVLSAVNLEIYRKLIEEEDLKSDLLTIKMLDKITKLEEVIINKHPEINAVSMGIIPKKIKHLSQMERKLYAAGDFKPIHLLGLLGGGLQLDPILNAINGRTKSLKKAIEIEKKSYLLTKIKVLFEDDYYTTKLHIQKDYINGFHYYCVDDDNFVSVLKSNNKTEIEFAMIKLALEYNKTIHHETQ